MDQKQKDNIVEPDIDPTFSDRKEANVASENIILRKNNLNSEHSLTPKDLSENVSPDLLVHNKTKPIENKKENIPPNTIEHAGPILQKGERQQEDKTMVSFPKAITTDTSNMYAYTMPRSRLTIPNVMGKTNTSTCGYLFHFVMTHRCIFLAFLVGIITMSVIVYILCAFA